MFGKLFAWFICFLVFVPFGADLAVLIDFKFVQENWWIYLVTIPVSGLVVFTDGLSV